MKKNLLLLLLLFPAVVFSQIVDTSIVKTDSIISKIDTLKSIPASDTIHSTQKKIFIEGIVKEYFLCLSSGTIVETFY